MNCWEILAMEPTEDKRQIKRAYAQALKSCHPEDDPEGFMQLRQAYEMALSYYRFRSFEQETDDSSFREGEDSTANHTEPEEVQPEPEEPQEPVESPRISDLLDNLTNYSDIAIENALSGMDEASYEELEEEYQQLVSRLEILLNDEESADNVEQWRELFDHPLLRNYDGRGRFSSHLLCALGETLSIREDKNNFSPEVILTLCSFLEDATGVGDRAYLSVEDIITISELKFGTKRYVESKNRSLFDPPAGIRHLLWVLFSYKGRLRRTAFVLAVITIYPLLLFAFISSASDNIETEPVKPVPSEVVEWNGNVDSLLAVSLDHDQVITGEEMYHESESSSNPLGNVFRFFAVLVVIWVTASLLVKRINDYGAHPLTALLIFVPWANLFLFGRMVFSKEGDNIHGLSTQTAIGNLEKYHSFVFQKLGGRQDSL